MTDASGSTETLIVTRVSLDGVTLLRASPLPAGTRLSLRFADQPAHVPPFEGRITTEHTDEQDGFGMRLDPPCPGQRRFLLLRYCRETVVSSGVELGWIAGHAPADADEFSALHPYPVLVRCDEALGENELKRDADVYMVRNPRVQIGWFCPIHVGRARLSDISIDDPSVSRHHAVFERLPDRPGYLLLDKGSRNGTRVDRVPLAPMTPTAVATGARIVFGDLSYLFLSARDLFEAMNASGLLPASSQGATSRVESGHIPDGRP